MRTLFIALMLCSVSHADIFVARDNGSELNLLFRFDYGQVLGPTADGVPNDGTITIDTTAGTAAYSGIETNFSTRVSNAFPVNGFNGLNAIPWHVVFTVNGFNFLDTAPDQTLPIVPVSNTMATTAGVSQAQLNNTITGSWSITGPNESANGTFAIPFTFDSSAMQSQFEISRSVFDPTQILEIQTRERYPLTVQEADKPIFSGSLEGQDWTFSLDSASFVANYSSDVQPAAIPEPSALLFLAIPAAAMWAKKRLADRSTRRPQITRSVVLASMRLLWLVRRPGTLCRPR